MHKLYNLRETLCEELEKVAKKDSIDTNDLNVIDKLAHSIKNLDKIIGEESYGGGYYMGSYDRGWDSHNRGSYDSYGYHDSYARRGRDGDGDGRYNEGRSRDGYSRDMKERLNRMMREASNDKERDTIMRCLEELDRL